MMILGQTLAAVLPLVLSMMRLLNSTRSPLTKLCLAATLVWLMPGTAAADKGRAKELFNLCATCHGDQGQGNQAIKAPPIAGLPAWYVKAQLDKFRNGARGAHPRDVSGLRMRPMMRALDAADAELMVQYVADLTPVPQPETIKGSLVKGETAYQVCSACHGPQAEGNEQLGAPPLISSADWYMYDQLVKFKVGIRGGNPAVDPIGASMQGIATSLDEEAMKNVVTYINALKPAP